MTSSKEHKAHKAFEPTRRESGMAPGESHEANQVMSDIYSAKQLLEGLREPFDIAQVLNTTGYKKLPDIEKVYVQKRLIAEMGINLPEELKPPSEAFSALDAEIQAIQDTGKRALGESSIDEPDEPEATLEEKIAGTTRLLQNNFTAAKDAGEEFSVTDEITPYADELGIEGVTRLREELQRAGVTDLEAPKAIPPDRLPEPEEARRLKKPTFVQFDYQEGRLIEILQFEGEAKKISRPTRAIDLPRDFEKIAADPKNLTTALERLTELYVATGPKETKVMPLREGRRREGKFIGFVVRFGKTRDEMQITPDADMLQAINDTVQGGGSYWDTPGFQRWRDDEKYRAKKEYLKRKTEELMHSFGISAEPIPTRGIKPAEAITPQDAGLTEERASRLQELVRTNLLREFKERLLNTYPKLTGVLAHGLAEALLEDQDIEQAFQEALQTLKAAKRH